MQWIAVRRPAVNWTPTGRVGWRGRVGAAGRLLRTKTTHEGEDGDGNPQGRAGGWRLKAATGGQATVSPGNPFVGPGSSCQGYYSPHEWARARRRGCFRPSPAPHLTGSRPAPWAGGMTSISSLLNILCNEVLYSQYLTHAQQGLPQQTLTGSLCHRDSRRNTSGRSSSSASSSIRSPHPSLVAGPDSIQPRRNCSARARRTRRTVTGQLPRCLVAQTANRLHSQGPKPETSPLRYPIEPAWSTKTAQTQSPSHVSRSLLGHPAHHVFFVPTAQVRRDKGRLCFRLAPQQALFPSSPR